MRGCMDLANRILNLKLLKHTYPIVLGVFFCLEYSAFGADIYKFCIALYVYMYIRMCSNLCMYICRYMPIIHFKSLLETVFFQFSYL